MAGQTNFAKAPPLQITFRVEPPGFDEGFDPVCYETLVLIHRHFESDRNVTDNERNLAELRPAVRQDGLIDEVGRHRICGCKSARAFGNIMPSGIDSKREEWLSMNYNS